MKMKLSRSINSGVEYYWKRTSSWKWIDGSERWWEIFVRFHDGMNGVGGLLGDELWRWNGSNQVMVTRPFNLGCAESVELINQLELQFLKD